MRFTGLLLAPLLLLGKTAMAQVCPDAITPTQRPLVLVNSGSAALVPARLLYTIKAHPAWYNGPNPPLVARIDYNIVCNGQVVIRKGSRLVGAILEGNARSETHGASRLKIRFSELQKGGQLRSWFLIGKVVGLAAPHSQSLQTLRDQVSGLGDLKLDSNDGTLSSFTQENLTLSSGTQVLVSIENPKGSSWFYENPPDRPLFVNLFGGCASTAGITHGTSLMLRLKKGVETPKARAGDHVSAVTALDLRCFEKKVIPAYSKVYGHVTEAKASTRPGDESQLGIVFDEIHLRHNRILHMNATLEDLRVWSWGADYVESVGCNPTALVEVCGGDWQPYATVVKATSLSVDEAHSAISSSMPEVKLTPGDQLIVRINEVH